MAGQRRTKWIFIIGMLACMLAFHLIGAWAKVGPIQMRKPLAIFAMALFVFPIGFLYGRNSGRRDDFGKISRFFFVLAVLGFIIGIASGPVVTGLCGGYLVGCVVGRIVWSRVTEKYGDTIEADKVWNIARSEHLPPKQHPCLVYLKSQDAPTRRKILLLRILELLLLIGGMAISVVPVVTDSLDSLARILLLRPNDGTLYFITTDPIVVAVPLIMLSLCVSGALAEWLLPRLAGARMDAWQHFKSLRSKHDSAPAWATMIFTFLLCSSIFLFMDSYVRVTADGVNMNRYWGIGTRLYSWEQIRTVDVHVEYYTCRNCSRQHERAVGTVTFTDGSEWKPDTSFARRASHIQKALRYIRSRKGL